MCSYNKRNMLPFADTDFVVVHGSSDDGNSGMRKAR